MKKLTKMIVAVALVGGAIGAVVPAASADTTPGCVTRQEWRRVHSGMLARRVCEHIYGTGGHIHPGSRSGTMFISATTRRARRGHETWIRFDGKRVFSKFYLGDRDH